MQAIDIATELTRTILGVDVYFRSGGTGGEDKLDQEGLVPVHWSPLEAAEVIDWDDAARRLDYLLRASSVLAEPYERDWLSEQTTSALTLVRWLRGDPLTYSEVVAGTLRIDPAPPSAAHLARVRSLRDGAVEQAGHASYAGYLESSLVAPNDVTDVMRSLIAQAHERTRISMPHLRLRDDVIGVRAVTGTAFSAYCDYPGRAVWVNTDVPFTQADLKHLVAHEAYPGHDAHMAHRDALVSSGEMLPDAALVVTNTASSVLFEGIAERGLDLLAWRDDVDDRIAWAQARLEWLASIEVAHGLNTGRLSAAEAQRFLRATCDADDAWIDAKIRFVTHRVRAPFVYGYWWGGAVVGAWWRHVHATHRDAAIKFLYDRMHSPTTLAAHWREEDLTHEH